MPVHRQRFDGAILDRHEGRREDAEFLAERWSVARVVQVVGGRVAVAGSPPRLHLAPTDDATVPDGACLLGSAAGVAFWSAEGEDAPSGASLLDLRSAGRLLPAFEAGLAAHAAALHAGHRSSAYCGACGAPTVAEMAGERRVCTACGRAVFPRTDPAVITLVTRGEECLLVHQPGWKPGIFATVAGFVGPGESLESAVAREVREEVGLELADVAYFASQPWPFPTSLMIGFFAEAVPTSRVRLSEEVSEARWLTRDALAAALRAGDIGIAPGLSISYSLVAHWYGDPQALATLAEASPIRL